MDENEVTEESNAGTESPQENASASKNMKHLDFITSLVIMGVSVFVAVEAYGYYVRSRKEFYASPGFMPIIIAVALFLLAIYLMYQSLDKSSLKENLGRLREAIPGGLKSIQFKNTLVGLIIFGIYIYVLLRFLPFWLASIIVLFACFVYLKAAKIFKSAVISIISAAGIVLLFQIVFRVPMP